MLAMRTKIAQVVSLLTAVLLVPLTGTSLRAAVKDAPFLQDTAVRIENAPDLAGAKFLKLRIDRDGVVFVLTDKGVARLFEQRLALDHSFRPLSGLKALDINDHLGDLYYLYEDRILSNGQAGEPYWSLPKGAYRSFAVSEGNVLLVIGEAGLQRAFQKKLDPVDGLTSQVLKDIQPWRNEFFVAASNAVYRIQGTKAKLFTRTNLPITCLALHGVELLIGTTGGYYGLRASDGERMTPLQVRLPSTNITCITPEAHSGLWIGSTRGAFKVGRSGEIAYYAGRRWLLDDDVVDVQVAPDGDVYVLSRTGLNKIDYVSMTLEQKAAYFDRKVRQRHNRFGFAAELRLPRPGDVTSAEMIDTDNDGTWSNYYMASQGFRYAATGDSEARTNAWRTFQAMERLEQLANRKGFPARTFERKGFKYSDVDRWRDAADPNWEWKGHTSSDEIAAHTFGCAVMYEVVAKTPGEKERVTRFFKKIMDHIIANHWNLVDVDGKPTLWGRWSPEYVNHYPETIGDRRLNSAELIASLQLAYRMTGKDEYKRSIYTLMDDHGYLTNILISATNTAPTPGFMHEGIDMGDVWNHSDDLLSFVTYWVLNRFALTESLRLQYAATVREHWEIERFERNPLWNFVYASTGARDYDLDGAMWTLRKFPLDLITWRMENSHRADITRLPKNFRQMEVQELLPPGERQMTRWNTQPFILDGGDGGHTEFAGDEFLLPYWMGRFLKIIR